MKNDSMAHATHDLAARIQWYEQKKADKACLADLSCKRYPDFRIGSLEVPAIILPLVLSGLFICFRFGRYKNTFTKPGPHIRPAEDRREAEAPPESRFRSIIRNAHNFYVLHKTLRSFGLVGHENVPAVCLSEMVINLIVGVVLEQSMLQGYIILSLTWLCLGLQAFHLTTPSPNLASLVGGVALAIIFQENMGRAFISSALLWVYAHDATFPKDHVLREFITFKIYGMLPGKYLIDFDVIKGEIWPICLLAISVVFKLLFGTTPVSSSELKATIILCAIIPCALFSTTFATSCLGFRFLIEGRPATPPAFTGIGTMIGLPMLGVITLVAKFDQRHRRWRRFETLGTDRAMRALLSISIDGVGWTIMGLTVIALIGRFAQLFD